MNKMKSYIDEKNPYYCLFPSYHLGNGLVVARRGADKMPEDNHLAHIDSNRVITYKNGLLGNGLHPQYLADYITVLSLTDDRDISATQEIKVFKKRPSKESLMILHKIHERVKLAGYSGILPNGNIVDRRIYPNAIPMQENSMLGIPKPRKL